ncbi:MAG: galactokinase [Anaerolineae bacterium]|nr:galactokinase [Anaerolineae bacterium]
MLSAGEERAISAFVDAFGRPPEVVARAPGRVNLIGEHTDYNDGFVLPVAIDRAVYVAASARADDRVTLVAVDFGERAEFALGRIERDPVHGWSNYPRGVAWVLQGRGLRLSGMDAAIHGDVPIGAGLSSSAALEVATAKALQALSGFALDDVELARAAQEAENRFVGMQCGIMDQFVSVLGRRDHALLIDCRFLEHRAVPMLAGYRVVVADTMKRRGLVDSQYNQRRAECEAGVRLLRQRLGGITALRDVTPAQLEEHKEVLPEVVYRRCRHVVRENERVLAAVAALGASDAATFGRLMLQSHASLRDDYEVSSPELDFMVDAALDIGGVVGTRMTGAGFGGCTVSLVREGAVGPLVEELRRRYSEWSGVAPDIYVCRAEQGAEAKRLP